jgi:thiol-disulfide isomerase/thioredoxin
MPKVHNFKTVNKTFMRFISITLISILFYTQLSASVSINGQLEEANSFKKVYLFQFFGTTLLKVDSTDLTSGSFSFDYKNDLPRGFYKIGPSQDKAVTVIAGRESFTLGFSMNNPESTLKTENSVENRVFQEFKKFNQDVLKLRSNINQQYNKAKEKGDQEGIEVAAQRMDSLNEAQNFFLANIEISYPESFVSKVAVSFIENPQATKFNFFDNIPVSDEELSRSDVIVFRISTYFTRMISPTLEEWENAAKFVLSIFPEGSKNRECAYMAVFQLFNAYAKEYSRPYAKMYLKEYPESIIAKQINAGLPLGPPDMGDLAPDIRLSDQDGKLNPLSGVKGELIMIDFWASWCGPCRKENPHVVKLYNRFKDKGFNIYEVSLDTDKVRWLKAIKDDQLEWEHVSDLKGWKSEGASIYQVKSIPATYLIDGKGEIVAKGLRGARLEKFVEEWFE